MSQQINLFNPALLKQKQRLSAVAMAQGLGVILLGAAAFAGYARVQAQALATQASAATVQLEAAKTQLAKVIAEHAPRQKNKEFEAELKRLETEVAEQRKALEIVRQGGVGDTQGYSSYLQAFSRQIVEGLWLTGFTIDSVGKRMELKGRALQPELVPAYIHRLKQEPVMQGKSFAQLTMSVPEAEPQKGGQSGESTAPEWRSAAKYMEFILKSSAHASAKEPALPASGPVPALPALPAGAAHPAGALPNLPGLQDAKALRDMAGAH